LIKVYVDGAYSSLRNQGGWAFIVLRDDVKIYSSSFPVKETTNNRMEIQAALEACLWCKLNGYTDITIFSDSMYVIGAVTKGNKRNKNVELLSDLDNAINGLNITWTYVKGHSGDRYNELCDALAVQASQVND
jgi:ribonuclease HI